VGYPPDETKDRRDVVDDARNAALAGAGSFAQDVRELRVKTDGVKFAGFERRLRERRERSRAFDGLQDFPGRGGGVAQHLDLLVAGQAGRHCGERPCAGRRVGDFGGSHESVAHAAKLVPRVARYALVATTPVARALTPPDNPPSAWCSCTSSRPSRVTSSPGTGPAWCYLSL
jgi:hypothetical protein